LVCAGSGALGQICRGVLLERRCTQPAVLVGTGIVQVEPPFDRVAVVQLRMWLDGDGDSELRSISRRSVAHHCHMEGLCRVIRRKHALDTQFLRGDCLWRSNSRDHRKII
jgi:hypothetical protein